MCVVSMVMDDYVDRWGRRYWPGIQPSTGSGTVLDNMSWTLPSAGPTQQELEEFRRLLERAREYDKRMNQPDCELEEKVATLKKLAAQLGVNLDDILKESANV